MRCPDQPASVPAAARRILRVADDGRRSYVVINP
jgi:hypothetical protein